MIIDADRFKMDLVGGLERTLSGKVKPSMCISTFPLEFCVRPETCRIMLISPNFISDHTMFHPSSLRSANF